MANRKNPKILYITHAPIIGGAELSLLSHVKAIDKRKFDVYVISSDLFIPYIKEIKGITAIPLQFYLLARFNPTVVIGLWKMVWSIMKVVKQYDIDIIHTNSVKTHYVGSLVALFTRRKLIWWMRDTTFNKRLFSLLHPIPVAIVSISNYVRTFYSTEKKNIIIYNGSDVYKKSYTQDELIALKQNLGTERKFVVGTVERLVEWKGVQNTIIVMDKLVHIHNILDIHLVIVGSGGEQEGSNEVELKKMVKKMKLEEHVSFVGWQKDPTKFMHVFDVCIHPVLEPEPFGLVVLEAMMSHCLVISSNLGGPAEFVKDRETGFLYDPEDIEMLAEKIMQVYKNKDDTAGITEGAYHFAVTSLTQEIETQYIEDLYTSLF